MPATLQFTTKAWDQMLLFVDHARGSENGPLKEISWLGTVDVVDGSTLRCDEVFLLKQEATSGDVEMDEHSISDFLVEMIGQGRSEDVGRIRLWGHSHAQMSSFFSGTDTATIKEWTGDWLVSIVLNGRHEFLAWLNTFKPWWAHEEMKVNIVSAPSAEETAAAKALIAERVTFPVYVTGTTWGDRSIGQPPVVSPVGPGQLKFYEGFWWKWDSKKKRWGRDLDAKLWPGETQDRKEYHKKWYSWNEKEGAWLPDEETTTILHETTLAEDYGYKPLPDGWGEEDEYQQLMLLVDLLLIEDTIASDMATEVSGDLGGDFESWPSNEVVELYGQVGRDIQDLSNALDLNKERTEWLLRAGLKEGDPEDAVLAYLIEWEGEDTEKAATP